MGIEAFVVKAETLDLRKIGSARRRRDIVGRMADDGLTAEILSGEVCKLLLAEVHLTFRVEPVRTATAAPGRHCYSNLTVMVRSDTVPELAMATLATTRSV
jgi:hypothetical protein